MENFHLLWRAGFGPELKNSNDNNKKIIDTIFNKNITLKKIKVTPENTKNLLELADSKDAKTQAEARKISRQLVRKLNLSWLDEMKNTENQLAEKMAFFWHGHFACQSRNIFHTENYLTILREKGLGKFGDLVKAIAKTPAMLSFLNNQQNRKTSPNENFARELMELFTLGRGNYTENDIKASARAFTGWSFAGNEFIFRKKFHDFDNKTFFGQTGNFDGEDIIDIILKKKQTAIFITQKIYRFFINDTIPEKRLNKLADVFYDSQYDIFILMKEIFTSSWFYDKENIGTKIKSPIEWLVGMQRQINLDFKNENPLLFVQKILGQMLLYPPNVAGWAGGKNWIDSGTLMFRLKFPTLLGENADLEIEAKDENDAGVTGVFENRIQKIEAKFGWNNFEKKFSNVSNNDKMYQSLQDYLWQVENKKLAKNIQNYLKNETKDALPKIIIAMMATPEYQMM
ncbi:MAG: DUF1800 domain-containing protein [Cytophagales bacterium]|nr:MAG: DUF1800 domain-containing protein [Cytophagales bacterium]